MNQYNQSQGYSGGNDTAPMPMEGYSPAMQMPNPRLQRQQSLIPPEVCQDLVDIRPLNATGGFSNLFRAHKVGLDVDVVIKRVKMVFKGRVNEQSEARIMTALRHQYLPRIYDLKQASDGYTYTIMELIEGCTLRDYVRARGCLDQKQVLKWTRQLCQVMDYMHTRKPKGIIHSDLKPENIMITPQDDICVIDFNASLEVQDGGAELEAIGATAGYAAPEQYNLPLKRFPENHPMRRLVQAAQGIGSISYRTDIYATGALAYYMLTGYDPRMWVDGVIPLDKYDIKLGYAFQQVIQKAMEPKPSARYKSASAMLAALNNLTKIDGRYRKWVWQCRVAALIIGLGLAVSTWCIVAGLGNLQENRQEEYLQLVQEAQQLRGAGQYEQCKNVLLEAICIDDDRVEAYLELGAMLYQLGEYDQAIDLMEDVEYGQSGSMGSEDFQDAQGQIAYILGSCYYQLENYVEAQSNYQTAVYFCPDEPVYQRELAVCYAKNGNKSLAEDTLRILKELQCSDADIALVEGEILYAYGQYEEAYADLVSAACATEDAALMGRSYLLAAKCCQQLGGEWIDTQISMLETASVRMGTGNSLVLQHLSEAYLAKSAQPGEDSLACYESALNCLQQLMDRGFSSFAIRKNAAVTLQYLDRYDESEEILKRMLEDYPTDYRVNMQLALLCADREGAKAAADRDYADFGVYWRDAERLYQNAAVQDSQMLQLEELAKQLEDLGWSF